MVALLQRPLRSGVSRPRSGYRPSPRLCRLAPVSSSRPLPLVLLAGGSRRFEVLPDGKAVTESDRAALAGYKAIDLRIGGRPVIELGVRRFRSSPVFSPIYIAGPEKLYADLDLGDVRFVDTDGDFGTNLQNATEAIHAEHPDAMIAYSTADVLPDPGELATAVADFERHRPCDFWMLECRVPEDPSRLGESAWKPRYRITGDGDSTPVETLPGHLVVADPRAVRRRFTYQIFDLAYGTRNLPIPRRTWKITVGLGARFWQAEMEEIRHGRRPTVVWDVLVHGFGFAFELWRGIHHTRMEDRIRRIFVHRRHRRTYPRRRGRVAVLHALSLAKDVDTAEEARELELELGGSGADGKGGALE